MAKVTAYLGLGSNQGDRMENLEKGIEFLRGGIEALEVSPIYETEPVGFTEQPAFLNCVCKGETSLSPLELLALAKEAEAALGREPTFRNGPRTLDVDILFYGDEVLSEPGLEVPHPRLNERGFVLVPLADIAPNLRHPVSGATVKEMLERLVQQQGDAGIKAQVSRI